MCIWKTDLKTPLFLKAPHSEQNYGIQMPDSTIKRVIMQPTNCIMELRWKEIYTACEISASEVKSNFNKVFRFKTTRNSSANFRACKVISELYIRNQQPRCLLPEAGAVNIVVGLVKITVAFNRNIIIVNHVHNNIGFVKYLVILMVTRLLNLRLCFVIEPDGWKRDRDRVKVHVFDDVLFKF